MTSATEHLRALLDERGVEWDYGIGGAYTTEFSANGVMLNFMDCGDGVICSTIIAPEQAVAATLGPGTCHIDLVGYNEREDRFQCNSCDWSMWFRRGTLPCFNYCPNCGKRVVG